MFLSGSFNQFKFEFPKVFIPEELNEKYKPFLKRIPGCMIEEPIEFLNYAVKKVSLQLNPQNYVPIEQRDRQTPYVRRSRSDEHPMFNYNKEITITFQTDSSYLIWFLLCDLWEYYYCTKDKFLPALPGMILLDARGKELYRVSMKDVLFTGVDGLEFNFSDNTVDTKELNATFFANYVNCELATSRDNHIMK